MFVFLHRILKSSKMEIEENAKEMELALARAWKRDCCKQLKLPWRFKMAVKNGTYSLEEKREAVAYFNKNEVPKQIEELLNKMFKEKPDDVFGYMVRRYHSVLLSVFVRWGVNLITTDFFTVPVKDFSGIPVRVWQYRIK